MLDKNKIFKTVFRLHIYFGLYAASYFLIAGITAINFQHRFLNGCEKPVDEYSTGINLPSGASNDSLAAAATDSLKLFGYMPRWQYSCDSACNFSFSVIRPGCRHRITVDSSCRRLHIVRYFTGMESILSGMHLSIDYDIDRWPMRIWSFYGQSAALLGLLAALISVYFWFRKSVRKKSEWVTISAVAAFSLFYILYIWLAG